MVGVPLARRTRKRAAKLTRPTRIDAVLGYAALGWPSAPGAHPLRHGSRACSCDRLGCPDPGAHPLSPAWHLQATTDATQLTRWWQHEPDANVILPTGRVFDVFDVPLAAGLAALTRLDEAGSHSGPGAAPRPPGGAGRTRPNTPARAWGWGYWPSPGSDAGT
ncbi:bifunctional DNA primase/polymerase [Nonomuraea sp. NPDC059022]|uniref:bifunctional DNA primase/polymerase n=1 Tax=Nonomuraea sp. NPDC059022 TaxID=3346705 RepID=UPI0036B7279E